MTTTTCSTSPTFAVLLALALEMHLQLTFDGTPFSLTRFARQPFVTESRLILIDADLPAFEMALTDALTAHTHRRISATMIQQIFRHLVVMQDLVKGGAK